MSESVSVCVDDEDLRLDFRGLEPADVVAMDINGQVRLNGSAVEGSRRVDATIAMRPDFARQLARVLEQVADDAERGEPTTTERRVEL